MDDDKNLVLVLDDDEDIHNLLKLELSKTNFNTKHALNEEEAILLLENHDFTYGVFDIILSSTTSSNTIIKYLSTEAAAKNKGLPLIIMSAHITDDYSKKLRMKGSSIIETLKKPIQSGELAAILNGDQEKSVLLLEDDSDTSKLIKNELEKSSFNVYSVQDCQSAIKLLKTTKFLCAVVDNKLGANESSDVFFHYLRNEGLDLNLPLILTGTTVREDLEVDSFLLVFDTVEKPFKRGTYVKSIERLLSWKENQNSSHVSNIDNLEELFTLDQEKVEDIRVSGSVGIDNHHELVAGEPDDLSEETTRVKEQSKNEETNKVVKSSSKKAASNQIWAVQNLQMPPEPSDMAAAQSYNPNKRNEDGITSVMMAALIGDVQMLQDAILYGGDISLRSKDGKSCLHYAAASKNPDAIKFLLEQGIKVNIRDEHSREALYYAIASKNIDNVNVLLEAGSRSSTRFEGKSYLTIAVLSEHVPSVLAMLEEGLSPSFKDYSGKTPLDYAKLKHNDEIYQILVNHLK